MGRKPKQGIDYFPADVDMFQDRKIKRLLRSAGGKGFTIYIYLLTHIYRDNGYFLEWDENSVFDVADDLNFAENVIEEAVNVCCSHGLFSKEMLTDMGVLTSESIQQRWHKIVTDAKRVDTEIKREYLIIDGKSVFLTGEMEFPTEEIEKPPEESTQSKVKDSIGKKSKGEYGADAPAHKPDSFDDVITFFRNNRGTEDMAFEFFHTYNSQNWVKKNGRAITSWQSAAALWIKRDHHDKPEWKQNKPNGGTNGAYKSKGDRHAEALQSL